MKAQTLLLSMCLVLAAGAHASERRHLADGVKSGPLYPVTAITGAGTAQAKATGRVDKTSALEFCEVYGTTEDCVEATLKEQEGKEVRAEANCMTGSMLSVDGKSYAMDGEWNGQRTRWKTGDGKALAESQSDLQAALVQNWEALCRTTSKPAVSHAPSPVLATVPASPASSPSPSPVRSPGTGSAWNHNGSMMRVDTERGVILYEQPKASIRDVAQPGTVLFRGAIGQPGAGQRIEGVAYAFKKGCRPAEYPVSGFYTSDGSSIVLQGAGPTWSGCSYRLTSSSRHTTLRFTALPPR